MSEHYFPPYARKCSKCGAPKGTDTLCPVADQKESSERILPQKRTSSSAERVEVESKATRRSIAPSKNAPQISKEEEILSQLIDLRQRFEQSEHEKEELRRESQRLRRENKEFRRENKEFRRDINELKTHVDALRKMGSPDKSHAVFLLYLSKRNEESFPTGTCFAASRGYLITARHNLFEADSEIDYNLYTKIHIMERQLPDTSTSSSNYYQQEVLLEIVDAGAATTDEDLSFENDWLILHRLDKKTFRTYISPRITTEEERIWFTHNPQRLTIYHFPITRMQQDFLPLIVSREPTRTHTFFGNRRLGLICQERMNISKGSCGGPYVFTEDHNVAAVAFHVEGLSALEITKVPKHIEHFRDAVISTTSDTPIGLCFGADTKFALALKKYNIAEQTSSKKH